MVGRSGGHDRVLRTPRSHVVRDAVARALAEDLTPLGDLTSALLPDPTSDRRRRFVAREPGRLAGAACAIETFRQVDDRSSSSGARRRRRGRAGRPSATVDGPLASILTAERTALNFLGHLSGIATLTRPYVDAAAAAGSAQVWDTRKTTPGLRTLEKAAVRAGGGRNHRGNLSDWILLKDNHIAGIGIAEAVAAAADPLARPHGARRVRPPRPGRRGRRPPAPTRSCSTT